MVKKITNKAEIQSKCEMWFTWYCEVLKERGFIKEWSKTDVAYPLSESVEIEYKDKKGKIQTRTLVQAHQETPDFRIIWDKSAVGYFIRVEDEDPNLYPFYSVYDAITDEYETIVEVKPTFDQNNMTREFMIDQKWVWQKHRIYIQLIKLGTDKASFFNKTFTPKRFLFQDVRINNKRTIKFKPRPLSEYLKLQQEKRFKMYGKFN